MAFRTARFETHPSIEAAVDLTTASKLTKRMSQTHGYNLELRFVIWMELVNLRRWLSPRMASNLKIHDTCGVHNLHGMPGVAGAILTAVVVAVRPHRLTPRGKDGAV